MGAGPCLPQPQAVISPVLPPSCVPGAAIRNLERGFASEQAWG